MDGGTLELLQRDQMQRDKLTTQINSPTKPSLAGFTQNKKASPFKGPDARVVIDAELKRLPSPVDIFIDECVFCCSFRTSQFHGPMVRYLQGRVVSIEERNSSNGIYVHKKCLEWAPRVWFNGDIIMNLELEISRASRLRCSRCGLHGAALGCYYKRCNKSFHVPCAVQIIDCRWDVDNAFVLCPEHVSQTLPCDELSLHTKKNDNSSSLPQSQYRDKKGDFDDHRRENQHTDQHDTSNVSSLPQSQRSHKEGIPTNSSWDGKQIEQLKTTSSFLPGGFSQYTDKEGNFDDYRRENQQTDQRNTSNASSLPLSQHSHKKGIPTNGSRDGQQIDQLDTSSCSSLPLGQDSDNKGISKNRERDDQQTHQRNTSSLPSLPQRCHPDKEGISNACQGEEIKADQPDTSSCPSDQLVLLGSSLSASEKESLEEFACWTNATVTKEWAENVSHVIVGKGAGSTWIRSYEVLMAILYGKWLVHFEWIVDCLEMLPGPEACYEVTLSIDSDRPIDGPKKGRIRAAEGAPKLFSGLCFCLSAYMSPDDRGRMRDLVTAAGGQILEGSDPRLLLEHSSGDSSVKPYFVYDGGAPREFTSSSLLDLEEGVEHAASGAQVISHLRVLGAVAAHDAETLNRKKGGLSFTS